MVPRTLRIPGRAAFIALVCLATAAGALAAASPGASSLPAAAPRPDPVIVIDGDFRDWKRIRKLDPQGWQIAVAEGPRYLYLHFRMPEEAILQNSASRTVLLLDLDDDAATGREIEGIGADLEWNFSARGGRLREGDEWRPIGPADIGLVTAPTVSTQRVELAIDADVTAAPSQRRRKFLRGVLTTPNRLLGLDDPAVRFSYRRGKNEVDEPKALDPARDPEVGLRVVNYNIERDGLFEAERAGAYGRVFRALDADVIGFQEIFVNSVSAAGALLDSWAPLPGGARWQTAAADSDVGVASRFPIESTWNISPGAVDAYLIDTRSRLGTRVLVLVVSLKCCDDLEGLRREQIDDILDFWRDAMSAGGEVTVPEGTPIVMIGDMNLVGDAAELRALRDGIPFDGGEGFDPDWDDSALTDLRPRHIALPMAYTWRRDDGTSGFSPGRLDFIFYTDSVLEVDRGFVLHSPSLRRKLRRSLGLRRLDTRTASDHMPVVADFVLNEPN